MADSDITVGGLTAVGGVGQIALSWDKPIDPHSPGGLPYLQLGAVEVWSAASNDRALATKISESGDANSFVHAGLSRGEQRWYWIRPRNRAGSYGEWHPTSATGGVEGVESNNIYLFGQDGFFRNTNGFLTQWGRAVSSTITIDLFDGGGIIPHAGLVRAIYTVPFEQVFSFNAIAILPRYGNIVDVGVIYLFDSGYIVQTTDAMTNEPIDGVTVIWRAEGV